MYARFEVHCFAGRKQAENKIVLDHWFVGLSFCVEFAGPPWEKANPFTRGNIVRYVSSCSHLKTSKQMKAFFTDQLLRLVLCHFLIPVMSGSTAFSRSSTTFGAGTLPERLNSLISPKRFACVFPLGFDFDRVTCAPVFIWAGLVLWFHVSVHHHFVAAVSVARHESSARGAC
jgi:hypothetical protein